VLAVDPRLEQGLRGLRCVPLVSLLLSLASAQAGCGARSERSSPGAGGASASNTGGAPAAGGVTSDDGVLMIPVEARRANTLSLLLEDIGGRFGPAEPHELSFASGNEYPNVVSFDLTGSFIFEEDGGLFDATSGLQLTTVAASPGLHASRVDDKHFEVEFEVDGDFTLSLAGSWLPAKATHPAASDFAVDVAVHVRQVARVDWISCETEPVYLVSGAPFHTGYHRLYDSSGAPFSPANATENNASLSVHARAGTQLTATAGLRSLVAMGDEQVVSVRHAGVEVSRFVLVPLARIDHLAASFFVPAGPRGGFNEIESGGSMLLGPPATEPVHVRAVPALSVAGTPVCSRVLPEWFRLRSQTADVCPLVTSPICEDCRDEDTLAEGVSLEGAGQCHFAVDAPQMNAGRGLTTEFVVEVLPRD
jgi:hypothetical protein